MPSSPIRRLAPALLALGLAGFPGAPGALAQDHDQAQDLDGARAAFDDGRFLEAADMGEALGTGDGLALAAESLAIQGYYLAAEDDKQPLFQRAMALAEKAVEIDDANAETHLQASHAMGRYAQTIGVLQALKEGFAERIRAQLDRALELDPDMAAAHVSLAAWHAEIVRSAGFMAGVLYGADEDDALAHYQKALELAPDDPSVNLEYGIGLLTLDETANTDRARALFRHVLELPSDTAYERILHDQAQRRLDALGG